MMSMLYITEILKRGKNKQDKAGLKLLIAPRSVTKLYKNIGRAQFPAELGQNFA